MAHRVTADGAFGASDGFDWHSFALGVATMTTTTTTTSAVREVSAEMEGPNEGVVRGRTLAPPRRPPRRKGEYWSGYHLQNGSELVPVPRHAIKRIRPFFEPPPLGACFGCGDADCSHGWALPDLRAVVVVALPGRTAAERACGWFVRFTFTPTTLVRIPGRIVALLQTHAVGDPAFRESRLATAAPVDDGRAFVQRASLLFARRLRQQQDARLLARKSRRAADNHDDGAAPPPPSPSSPANAATDQTCVVCIDGRADARPRCARGTCNVALCAACHEALRGLCPICDRGLQAALHECAACFEPRPLRASGFPCATCGQGRVCRVCYQSCADCETCTLSLR